MVNHPKIQIYGFKDIPLDEDCYLISDSYVNEFEKALLETVSDGKDPSGTGYVSYVAIRKINDNSMELSWYPNIHTRFHEVSITLPKKEFVSCLGSWQYDVKPYIFVTHDWVEQLYLKQYAVFALVDAIGVKKALKDLTLSKEKLIALRDAIDEVASRYPQILFFSFADSLLLKSNWSVGSFHKGIKCTYTPEIFLKAVAELKDIYNRTLNLDVYAVLTQGNNEYYDESLHHVSLSQNHISLNSLGIPFAELKAIESAARAAIKNKVHPRAELYMDDQFYHSINFKPGITKNYCSKNNYSAILKDDACFYFYTDFKNIISNFK